MSAFYIQSLVKIIDILRLIGYLANLPIYGICSHTVYHLHNEVCITHEKKHPSDCPQSVCVTQRQARASCKCKKAGYLGTGICSSYVKWLLLLPWWHAPLIDWLETVTIYQGGWLLVRWCEVKVGVGGRKKPALATSTGPQLNITTEINIET